MASLTLAPTPPSSSQIVALLVLTRKSASPLVSINSQVANISASDVSMLLAKVDHARHRTNPAGASSSTSKVSRSKGKPSSLSLVSSVDSRAAKINDMAAEVSHSMITHR